MSAGFSDKEHLDIVCIFNKDNSIRHIFQKTKLTKGLYWRNLRIDEVIKYKLLGYI